jgi:hypothetical protein
LTAFSAAHFIFVSFTSLYVVFQRFTPWYKKHDEGVPTPNFSSALDLVTRVDVLLIEARLSFSAELPPIMCHTYMRIVAAVILLTEVMPAFSSRWYTVTMSPLLHLVGTVGHPTGLRQQRTRTPAAAPPTQVAAAGRLRQLCIYVE